MGVKFYPCTMCGDVFADAGPYDYCEGCGHRYCGWCAFNKYEDDPESQVTWCGGNHSSNEDSDDDDDDSPPSRCRCVCVACTRDPARRTVVTDEDLIEWLISRQGLGGKNNMQAIKTLYVKEVLEI